MERMINKFEIRKKEASIGGAHIYCWVMIEIEAKTRLRAGEGAHFFFTLIFLVATGLIEREYTSESCEVNLRLLVDLLFYS